jgi:hypothetical protein
VNVRALVALALVGSMLLLASNAAADPITDATRTAAYAKRVVLNQAQHLPAIPAIPELPEIPGIPDVQVPDLNDLPTPDEVVQSVPDPAQLVEQLPLPELPAIPGVPDPQGLAAYEYSYAWHVVSYQLSRL